MDIEPGHCPQCGKYCANISAMANEEHLGKVTGKCKKHGKVDLSQQPWSWEDFFGDE